MEAGALSDTDFVASSPLGGSEWRPKSRGQPTSVELPGVQMDGQTDKCNFSIMMYMGMSGPSLLIVYRLYDIYGIALSTKFTC